EEHFWDGALPQTPRCCAFAPGFLDRKASCARTSGIPAPESALGLRLRRALPSAQVRLVYQGWNRRRLHNLLDAPRGGRVRRSDKLFIDFSCLWILPHGKVGVTQKQKCRRPPQ